MIFFSRISEQSCYSNFVSHVQALGTYSTEKLYQMQCTIILKNCLRDLTEEFTWELVGRKNSFSFAWHDIFRRFTVERVPS